MNATENSKAIFSASFTQYVEHVQAKHETPLKPQQIQFLRYPFVTAVYWAYKKQKTVKRQNLALYYNTVFKQFSLTLN